MTAQAGRRSGKKVGRATSIRWTFADRSVDRSGDDDINVEIDIVVKNGSGSEGRGEVVRRKR